MSKLKGHSSLDIKNTPRIKEEKIGLVDEKSFETKTYRLSLESIDALEKLSKRLSSEARIKIAMGKVLELCIFACEDKTFNELTES
jgi:hypothetical protein